MSVERRRDTILRVVECVFVRRGRAPVHERVVVCRRGETPDDLPRRGDKHAPVRPLDQRNRLADGRTDDPAPFRTGAAGGSTTSSASSRVGGPAGPKFEAFHRAGRGRLYRQVEATGGCHVWAERLGLRFSDRTTSRRPWTEDRIRTTRCAYLVDKPVWPSRRRFIEDGFGAVRWAVNRYGGVDRWAAEFGLVRENRSEGKRRYWTDERIERELRAFVAEEGGWPKRQKVRDAGMGSLLRAMDHAGGRGVWEPRIACPR